MVSGLYCGSMLVAWKSIHSLIVDGKLVWFTLIKKALEEGTMKKRDLVSSFLLFFFF